MFWSTNFSTKHRNKNSNGKKEASQKETISGGRCKIVFFFHRPLENFDFPVCSSQFGQPTENRIEFQLRNAVFMKSPIYFLVIVIVVVAILFTLLFHDVMLCYSSRVDQIKLKPTKAYNLFKSD